MSILKLLSFDPKELIEYWANDFLRRVYKTAKFSPKWLFDASLVANFLDLGVVWDGFRLMKGKRSLLEYYQVNELLKSMRKF